MFLERATDGGTIMTTAIDLFLRNHRTIRKALMTLDRALLVQGPSWPIVARNMAHYLDLELREYWGSEERLVFRPLAETGPDAARVVAEMEREHVELESRLAEFKSLTQCAGAAALSELVHERGLGLVKEFLHHMFLEEEVGFVLAEERLGEARLAEVADQVILLEKTALELEEPAALD
jgi:iron-sulfur cluster repair protein YtfE (RIC family)